MESSLYRPVESPATKWGAIAASVAMHGVLLLVLFYGMHWQSNPSETISADLVASLPALPPPPTAAPQPKPEPPAPVIKPQPRPEPVDEPPPPVKPDIAIKQPEKKPKKEEPKPEPKPEPRPEPKKPEPKPEPKKSESKPEPKKDVDRNDELLKMDSDRVSRINRSNNTSRDSTSDRMAAMMNQDTQRRVGNAALGNALDEWKKKIEGKVRGKLILPPSVKGDPTATFKIDLLPDCSLAQDPQLVKSSGNPVLDEAIKNAIIKASPLPMPSKQEVFQRSLTLVFHPLRDE
ncbi:cell envelope integrity protein TolA [Uliginosibacterium gangwonense]|uniref:cell envelope integrity protein TolA n=1 Tax=Uliginosibacterium gangwonense TaxID=392736 RepID=UPI0003648704|nr:cell envelope integrity protein TolA [Uliginosibacterium gangwonense]